MKICSGCHQEFHREEFSSRQWKLNSNQRRCKGCINTNQLQSTISNERSNVSTNKNGRNSIDECGPECWICLHNTVDLRRQCSCKGSSGFAHLSCMVKYARDACCNVEGLAPWERYATQQMQRNLMIFDIVSLDNRVNKLRDVWKICPNCKQRYRGQLRVDMANELVSFVKNAYATHEQLWFCTDYPDAKIIPLISLAEKMEALAERRESHGSDDNYNSVKEIALALLVEINKIKNDNSIMSQHGFQVQTIEVMAYANLSDTMPAGDPRKIKYLDKSMAIQKKILPFDTPESRLNDLTLNYMNNESEEADAHWESWEEMRASYELNIKKRRERHGEGDLRAMKFELEYAYELSISSPSHGYRIKGVRTLMDLCKRSALILGEDHELSKDVEMHLQAIKIIVVRISSGEDYGHEIFQAMQYENAAMTTCAVRSLSNKFEGGSFTHMDLLEYYRNIQETRNEDISTIQYVPSKSLVYYVGTIVVCRDLTESTNLNGKIGVVANQITTEGKTEWEYEILFEDENLGKQIVAHENTFIVFDLE